MIIQIDGGSIAVTEGFTNEVNSHKSFPAKFHTQGFVAAGTHTITLQPTVNTSTDFNDFFNVTVLELPF